MEPETIPTHNSSHSQPAHCRLRVLASLKSYPRAVTVHHVSPEVWECRSEERNRPV